MVLQTLPITRVADPDPNYDAAGSGSRINSSAVKNVMLPTGTKCYFYAAGGWLVWIDVPGGLSCVQSSAKVGILLPY